MEKTGQDNLEQLPEQPDSMSKLLHDIQSALEMALIKLRKRHKFVGERCSKIPDNFNHRDLFKVRSDADSETGYYGYAFSERISLMSRLHALGGDETLSSMFNFLSHDVSWLTFERLILEYFTQRGNLRLGHADSQGDNDVIARELKREIRGSLHPDDVDGLKLALSKAPQIAEQIEYPHMFLKAYVETLLDGKPRDITKINLSQLLDTIAHTTMLRFYKDDYLVIGPNDPVPTDRNHIVVDLQPAEVTTNLGMIWSIVYNLVKNAAKELSTAQNAPTYESRLKGKEGLKAQAIKLKVEQLEEHDVTLIHVVDTGQGLSADEIMNSVKEMLQNNLIDDTGLKISVKQALHQWDTNPFAIRSLTLGDVYDLAGLSRVSGFSTRARTASHSSGLGLWGANFLAQQLGGGIISTNTRDEGAAFTVVIPNDHFGKSGSPESNVVDLAEQIKRKLQSGEIPTKIAA